MPLSISATRTLTGLLVCCGLAASAGADLLPPSLTPLPTTGVGTPQYKFMSSAGVIAGDRSSNRAFCWSSGWGLSEMQATGAGVPTLAGSWTQSINASGTMLVQGCIPPPSGNGVCGTYMYTARADAPHVFNPVSPDPAQPGFAYNVVLGDSGAIAGQYSTAGSGIARTFVQSASGMHDLTGLFAPGTWVNPLKINASDRVLIQGPNQIYVWSEADGLVPVNAPGGAAATALDMNDRGEITGRYAAGGGVYLPFKYTPGAAAFGAGTWITLGSAAQFPNATPDRINNAGMVVGNYQSGAEGAAFLYTDAGGMQTLTGVPHTIVGFNSKGDILATDHDPVTYQTIALIKLFGKPARLVQDVIDPGQTQIVVDQVSDISDNGRFAVGGRTSATQWTRTAFLVTLRCAADFDGSGSVNTQDIFDFLSAWFAGDVKADIDASGALGTQDIFAFLDAWMAGC